MLLFIIKIDLVLANGPLTLRYENSGKLEITASGVGLTNLTTGIINLDVHGDVVQAFLYWSGYNTTDSPNGDDTIDFSVDGGVAVTLNADFVYGPDFWFDDGENRVFHYVYGENITNLISKGNHLYNISDVTIGNNYGAGIIVVFSDPHLDVCMVSIYDGLDSLFWNFTTPRGPNSEVLVLDTVNNIYGGQLESIFITGSEGTDRPNAVWSKTGKGSKPTNIINAIGAIEVEGPPAPYPFQDRDGPEWDTYKNNIQIPAGEEWIAVQIESVSDIPGKNGASLLWVAQGFKVCPYSPPPIGGMLITNIHLIIFKITLAIAILSIVTYKLKIS
jgi:hypothetical protein